VSDFLRGFLNNNKQSPDEASKNAIIRDKWDEESYQSILKEMKALRKSEEKLADVVTTGSSAYADNFYALLKAMPQLETRGNMRASHLVNHRVAQEAQELKEFKELRTYTVNDDVATALSSITMEPELEILFDKLKEEQKAAEELQKKMDQMAGLDQQESDIDDLLSQLEDDADEAEVQNYQEQKGAVQDAKDALQKAIDEGAQALQDALDGKTADIQSALKKMAGDAIGEQESIEQAESWGMSPGELKRLPANKRLELAKKISNDRFRRISELIGPMIRMAFAERQKRTIHSRDEIYDIETGNDLSRIIANELLALKHKALRNDFIRRFYEERLLQYKLKGEEKLAKGGIIFCEDGSGSMSGDRELWAKAVGLTLLQIAKSQKREFHGIHFGGPRQIKHFDFSDIRNVQIEQLIDFAEVFFSGGTCFMTPLSKALDILKVQYEKTGAVKADIVFCTDGQCAVDPAWLEAFKKEQDRLGFNVYGVVIGGTIMDEPLRTICDGKVTTVKRLTSGTDMRDVFGTL